MVGSPSFVKKKETGNVEARMLSSDAKKSKELDVLSKESSKVYQAIINLNLISDLNLDSLPLEQNQNFPIIYDRAENHDEAINRNESRSNLKSS